MKKIIVLVIVVSFIHNLIGSEVTYPWQEQWNRIADDDLKTYIKKFGETLESTSKKITALLKTHARERNVKANAFNAQLKEILDANTTDLIKDAKKFSHEIRSEAQNAFDYKIKNKIHHSMISNSPGATKIMRKNRKIFSTHHNK